MNHRERTGPEMIEPMIEPRKTRRTRKTKRKGKGSAGYQCVRRRTLEAPRGLISRRLLRLAVVDFSPSSAGLLVPTPD